MENDQRRQELTELPHGSDRRDHVLSGPVLCFDLPAEVEGLRRQPAYQSTAPSGKTLVKERDLRVVLIALRSKSRLERHDASGPISVQTIEGRLRLRLPEQTVELPAGRLLVLEPGIPHDVEAIEDSAFLLTIGRTRYQEVSDRHEPVP
jgi:quercetin dioxygenase-like cupin family protein